MPTITDTFTRANSTTTLGSTESPVIAWTANVGTWGISTNRGYQVSPSTVVVDYATLESGYTDHSFEAKITSLATDRYPGVVTRYVDANNMYQARVEGSTGVVKTYRFQAGVVTQLGTTFAFADGDKLKLETLEEPTGTRVNVYKNGTLQINPLDTAGSRPTSGTKFGITYAILNAATGSSFFDDVTAVYSVPADTMPAAHVKVEVAFTTDPDDPSPSWTDLTSRLDISAGLDVTRGRQDEYGAVQPGRCALVLDNTDGALTPGRTASTYYPNVKPSRRIRVKYVDPNTAAVQYRFDGYVEEWVTEWPGGNKYTQARVTAMDLLARLGTKRVFRSVVEETLLLNAPVVYYPLGEPEGATTAGDVTGTNPNTLSIVPVGTAGGMLTFGTGTGPGTDGIPAPMFAPSSTLSGFVLQGAMPLVGAAGDLTVRACVLASAGNNIGAVTLYDDTFVWRLRLGFNTLGQAIASITSAWTGDDFFLTGTNNLADGTTRNLALTLTRSGSTVTAKLFDGSTQLDTTTYTASSLPSFTQLVVGGERKQRLFTGTISHVAVYGTGLSSTMLGEQALSTSTGFAGERSDQRIARYASWVGLPTARQVLDTGQSTVAWVDTTGKKPLDAMQQITDTEQGVLFADTQGRLVFLSRVHAYSPQTIIATIDAHDTSQDTTPQVNKQELVNYMVGKRPDGPEIVWKDAASGNEHGVYDDSIEVVVATDAEVLGALQWKVSQRAQPVARVPDLDIDAMTNTDIQSQVRALDIGSRLQVTGQPTQAPTSTLDLIVQGYSESISVHAWRINTNVTAANIIQGWQVDDATFSQVDAGYRFVY